MENSKKTVVIATIKSWNIKNAIRFKKSFGHVYKVEIITNKENLTVERLNNLKPDYIFFPHWSWIIPKEIYERFNCVVFHIADLPYGRGGSPLQNQIIRKIYRTKISAIKVSEGIDTGDIYLKEDFYIGIGSAEEIFIRASEIIFFKMIPYILENEIIPYKQTGEVLEFRRRKPEESNITTANINSLEDFYDFIRMLDAEGYPRAFIRIGNLKIEFYNASLRSNKIIGIFEVVPYKEEL